MCLWFQDIPPIIQNLAPNHTVKASSAFTYDGIPISPTLVNDGNYGTVMITVNSYQCFITHDAAGGPNWIMVDLGRIAMVHRVVLFGRSDCSSCGLCFLCSIIITYCICLVDWNCMRTISKLSLNIINCTDSELIIQTSGTVYNIS